MSYGSNVLKLNKEDMCNRSYVNCSGGESFEPGKRDSTGTYAVPVAKNAIAKKNCSIKVFQTFTQCCLEYNIYMKNLNAIVIAVTF